MGNTCTPVVQGSSVPSYFSNPYPHASHLICCASALYSPISNVLYKTHGISEEVLPVFWRRVIVFPTVITCG